MLHEPDKFAEQLLAGFDMGEIQRNAIDRTYFAALRYIEMADAF